MAPRFVFSVVFAVFALPLAATWAEEEGVLVGETKAALGHADVRTTQRFYIRSEADRTANFVSALDRRLGVGFGHEMDTTAQTAEREIAPTA